jgi:predicted nucleotide-binding protein
MSPYRVVPKSSQWRPCSQCEGAVANPTSLQCLRHLDPQGRTRTLNEAGGHIDIRGVVVSSDLLVMIIDALQAAPPTQRTLLADWAVFSGEANFQALRDVGDLFCSDARFASAVSFAGMTIHRHAAFRRTQFVGPLDFSGGWFRGPTTFRRADFLDEASFENREASRTVIFEQATFVGPARFGRARFWADVSFMMAQFRSAVDFGGTRFARDSRYRLARFEQGPPSCDNLARFNEGWWPGKNTPRDAGQSVTSVDGAEHGTELSAAGPTEVADEPRREPKVFLSSSVEGLPVARLLQMALEEEHDVRTVFWRQAFGPSTYNLENLEKIFATADFGVFVFSPDDLVSKRDVTRRAPRDNIILEVGMSIGRLGRDRTFVVVPRDVDIEMPTDLQGLANVVYSEQQFADSQEQAMGLAATTLRIAMRKLNVRSEASE